ncbi:MAG: SdpA family antimicrobial peptide system protein [Actinomycetota bacterium]
MTDPGVGAFRRFVVLCCVVLVAFVTLSSLRVLPADVRFHVGQVFPEGWELFTRDPQLPIFRSALLRDGIWVRADRGPLSKASNVFGFRRNPRWQSVEIARLVEEVPNLDEWTQCADRPIDCLANVDNDDVRPVRNRTPFSSLCGRVGLVRQFVVPQSRATSTGDDFRTTHVVVLEAECS